MSFTHPNLGKEISPRGRIKFALVSIAVAIVLGTLGFHLIEGWPLATSLYLAVQTVTTVGYGDITPVTTGGRVFATMFMLVGVGTVLYALTTMVQTIVQSEVLATMGLRRRYREMNKLHNHFIICGAGRIGSRIIREVQRAKAQFVVIERNSDKAAAIHALGEHVLIGDATLEETLLEAGVKRASGLAVCLPDDADNLYVVLTARDLNPNLHIVSRAVEEQAETKLIRAGANRVVAPTIIGSYRMAQALMKPAVADFMDSLAAEGLDLGFEQIEVWPGATYVGKKLRETNIRVELDAVIVVIRRLHGQIIYHPSADAVIEAGDVLVVIGKKDSLVVMSQLAHGAEASKIHSLKS